MNICVIGGDKRMAILAEKAASDGCRVICCGFDSGIVGVNCLQTDSAEAAVRSSDVIILPLPVSRDGNSVFAPFSRFPIGVNEVISSLTPEKRVMCGMPDPSLMKRLTRTGAAVYDFFGREELSVRNAVPTAEGAIEIAMHETDRTVFGSNVLIIGYGRLGKATARRFSALGANVTVSARKNSDLAWISESGCTAVRTSDIRRYIPKADIIVNTVPSLILGVKELDAVGKGTVIIDLASSPGGVDFKYASAKGINAIAALSLPGKVAPATAAEAIYETILSILAENHSE